MGPAGGAFTCLQLYLLLSVLRGGGGARVRGLVGSLVITFTCVDVPVVTRGASLMGPVVKAGKVKRAFPNTYTPFNVMRMDPSASAVPRGVSNICRPHTCRCYTNCRRGSDSVINFDRARFDKAKRSSLNSVLLVPFAKGLRVGPNATSGPSDNCHSQFDRSARVSHPNCCRILLASSRVGIRLATARQANVRGCACPTSRGGRLVLSLGRNVCGCSNGIL